MAASPASVGVGGGGAYSCGTVAETREWMGALASFLARHRPLLEAHVVNFFKDRLWEMVDAEWMECLLREPVESLLKLPSGCVQFLHDLHVASIGTVLAQGMNSKKKHKGYLAQALSFEYQLPVVTIDASSHHASVTNTRAERIKKHYAAKCVEKQQFKVPRTVTCHVLSSDALAAVTLDACQDGDGEHVTETDNFTESSPQIEKPSHSIPQLFLAGLHACGDL